MEKICTSKRTELPTSMNYDQCYKKVQMKYQKDAEEQ